jgi:antitoxin (DNA-binding transcriptional repressor) of toxin-antitoxin stability system
MTLRSWIKTGEPIALVDNGEEVAKIIPGARKPEDSRPFGLAKGEFEVPESFGEPLPEDVLQSFEGE